MVAIIRHSPTMPMMTAGSLEGICCMRGRISSMTSHLSRCVNSFPRQMRLLTRTESSVVETHSFLIRGSSEFFIAW